MAALKPLALAGALLLACAAVGRAQPTDEDTTGRQLSVAPAYTFGSNVRGYLRVSNDVCDFKKAMEQNPPDYAAAKKLYLDGKNSFKSDGKIRTLRSMATGSYVGEPFWDEYTEYFGTPAFLDDVIVKALDGTPPFTTDAVRREVAVKSVESALQMNYLMHEMDEAADKIKEKSLTDAKGAPHNVDEVVALLVGEKTECSPWTVSTKRATDFGTMQTCTVSEVNNAMIAALKDAQAAARAGNLRAFQAASDKVKSLFAVTYTQATLKYAEEMNNDLAAGRPHEENQAEGYAFFRVIEPLVASANKTSAAAVKRILMPGSDVAAGADKRVAAAMRAAYPGLGITAEDVGVYGAKQNLGCKNVTSAAAPSASARGAVLAGAAAVAFAALL